MIGACWQSARFTKGDVVAYALVQSDSDPRNAYFVSESSGGKISCTCPAATMHRTNEPCKHAKYAIERDLLQGI